jgi:SAM-dependent methyltransferase
MAFEFVTREFKTLTGEQARLRLMAQNDKEFLSPDSGVVAVSRERWELAQDAEANGWLNLWRGAIEDRNTHHYAMFDYLFMLRDMPLKRGIELGCGPFSNMRVAVSTVKVETIELLDPLIESYLELPHCAYRDMKLRRLDGNTEPVAKLHAMPIEDMQVEQKYDLVILINVIEHCIDVRKIFANVWDLLVPGGVFIFHDKYFDHSEIAAEIETTYDTGHPLRPDRKFVDAFLRRFVTVFARFTTTTGDAKMTDTGDAIYFIGRKP